MSKPKRKWWGYAKNVLRSYPLLKKRKRTLDMQESRELEAVEKALDELKEMETGKERLIIAERVFFRQSHTLGGASMLAHISYETAVLYHRDLIISVGKHLGLA